MKIFNNDILIFIGDNRCDYRSLLSSKMPVTVDRFTIHQHKMIKMEQTASDIIRYVDQSQAGSGFMADLPEIPLADGMITDCPNIFLMVRTADCYPVIFYDSVNKVVAVAHSGREGTKLNISGKMIDQFINKFKSSPENIHAIIGPGISEAHYEVDEDTFNDFVAATDLPQNYRILDLLKVITKQILDKNIPSVNLQFIPECTYENQNYFSFRRDKTKNRQIALIGIINE